MMCASKGVQSDAHKVAEFRAMMRLRRTLLSDSGDYMMHNMTRMLIKVRYEYHPDFSIWHCRTMNDPPTEIRLLPRYLSTHGVQMSRCT